MDIAHNSYIADLPLHCGAAAITLTNCCYMAFSGVLFWQKWCYLPRSSLGHSLTPFTIWWAIACGCQTNNTGFLMEVVLFPRSTTLTPTNFTCICYLYELLSHSGELSPVVARRTTLTSFCYQVPTDQESCSDRCGKKHHSDTHELHLHLSFIWSWMSEC